MTFATRRAAVADALSLALDVAGVEVYPHLPIPLRVGSGWLVLKRADTEDITFAEQARVTYDVVIALGTDPIQAEKSLDQLAGPLIDACEQIGRGVSVSPFTLTIESTDFYCAVGTLITEVGA